MAFRFRKSVKIAPGIRVNFSKSGISTSVGRRGAMVNFSKRGTRVTAGIPGTGLSASRLYKSKSRPTPSERHGPAGYPVSEWITAGVMGVVMFGVLAYLATGFLSVLFGAVAAGCVVGMFLLLKPAKKSPAPRVEPTTLTTSPVVSTGLTATQTWKVRAAAAGGLTTPASKLEHDPGVTPTLSADMDDALPPGAPITQPKDDLAAMAARAESEAATYWRQPAGSRICAAPYYFQRAAILHRKRKQFAEEVLVCEAWEAIAADYALQDHDLAAAVHLGPRSQAILDRLPRARELLHRQR